ncbi:MAG: hypothetical protein IJ693_07065 [Bacteroidaceae bacterium]|nr:hypothetical protein [Bacteroidaceae bacterium]
MNKVYYRVGRHTYGVNFCDEKNTAALLPSSEPFRLDNAPAGDEPLLFELKVDDEWAPERKGEEIGQFDCGGNNHGVYRLEDGSYQIMVSDVAGRLCCVMQAVADFSSAVVSLTGNEHMRRFGLNNALMMMYAFAGADKMTVLMHASVIRKDGKGYLCLGVSGTGKSTHTSNWLKYVPDTDLMNDDNPVVRVCDDGVVRVFGSPWSGKTPCYRNVEASVGAFLQLKQAPYNKIQRLGAVKAYASLLPSCSVMKWDRRDYVGTSDTVSKILSLVPVFFLENLPNEEAVRMSYEAMTGMAWKN